MNCSLVTAGLDSSVKFFTPSAAEMNEMKELKEILKTNKEESERQLIPIPMSVVLFLLRRGIIGFDSDDDSDVVINALADIDDEN